MKSIITLNEIPLLAKTIASSLQQGDVIHLSGEIGAGKTTFAGFIIRSIMQAHSYVINKNNKNIKNNKTNNIDNIHNKDHDNDHSIHNIDGIMNFTNITSPTFSIVNEYKLSDHTDNIHIDNIYNINTKNKIIKNKITNILHFDLYRVKKVEELCYLGVDHLLESSISIVEWPEILHCSYHSITNVSTTTLNVSHDATVYTNNYIRDYLYDANRIILIKFSYIKDHINNARFMSCDDMRNQVKDKS